ncbi:50S ribosomal protein L19 [Helicobacter fennelliae]|uniref:Large ribosomal subunit protein bL19 n=1 Tax=Helicobacter fennelliae TaxID=215 RepID=A0A2X3DFF3_9HELI|nr:50S ribosomal protein L19 [Helicobacter fennelliae]SQB98229.1 50S ribosomal protein L19 [Helicobacter fennelliae]
MKNRYIENFEKAQIQNKNKQVPSFKAGDTIKLGIRIVEGDKSRIQNFEGICISIRGNGVDRTFTIRKIGANNIGVEKTFPLYSESLESIEVLRIGRVRRAKLFYLRDRKGKAARIKEDRS